MITYTPNLGGKMSFIYVLCAITFCMGYIVAKVKFMNDDDDLGCP